jgi:hypothetical protein
VAGNHPPEPPYAGDHQPGISVVGIAEPAATGKIPELSSRTVFCFGKNGLLHGAKLQVMKPPSLLFALFLIFPLLSALAADPPPEVGLCIAAPQKSGLSDFLKQYYSEEPEAPEKGQVESFHQIIQHYQSVK